MTFHREALPSKAPWKNATSNPVVGAMAKRQILVVDDDPQIRRLMRTACRSRLRGQRSAKRQSVEHGNVPSLT